MTRLFTALWPPEEVTAALAADVGGPVPGWRAVDPSTWHVTLAFHGEADPGVLARRLEADVRGLPAPRLRLAGAGEFPGVRWVGVEGPLAGLAAAARGMHDGPSAPFVAHLTVARRARRGPPGEPGEPAWSAHRGPWWTPAEAVLVASEAARRGPRYRPVHRVALGTGAGSAPHRGW